MAARAGLSVSELKAENTVETAIVTANWRKNWPVMPLMNAHGTNTAHSTRATAMTGPVTSSIALRAASRGGRPCSSQRSTFSTTTMASSTTMPMASTRPNSEMLFRLKPTAAMTAKVPMMATGTAISGISAARQFCRKTSTTMADQDHGLEQRVDHVVDRFADERRGVVGDLVVHALGEVGLQLLHLGPHPVGDVQGVGAGQLIDGQADRRAGRRRCRPMVVVLGAQLDAGHVAEADDADRRPARAGGAAAP